METELDLLVIDDEQVVLDAVEHICSSEGFTVKSAQDGQSALRALDQHRFRLVLCDIMMPEIDGFQLLNEIQRRFPMTPVIMSTGFSTVENAVKSLSAGAIDFVPKPFTADELMSSITRGLRYREFLKSPRTRAAVADDPRGFTVPCPSRYSRLGYMSWTVFESDGTALIGVSHAFARTIEGMNEAQLVDEQEEVVQGIQCAQIRTSTGLIHSVLSPLSGKVIERNALLEKDPHILEKDPYFAGWLYRIIPSDPEYELSQLTPCGSDTV